MTISNSSDLNVKDITFLNNIESVAVIGASRNRGFPFLRGYAEHFKGKVYAINPKVKKIPKYDNVEVYPSLLDIPGPVDYVYFKIPANGVLDVMDQCVEKGVKLVSLFTSDFSDSGTQEGLKREKELLKNREKILSLYRNLLEEEHSSILEYLGMHEKYAFEALNVNTVTELKADNSYYAIKDITIKQATKQEYADAKASVAIMLDASSSASGAVVHYNAGNLVDRMEFSFKKQEDDSETEESEEAVNVKK